MLKNKKAALKVTGSVMGEKTVNNILFRDTNRI